MHPPTLPVLVDITTSATPVRSVLRCGSLKTATTRLSRTAWSRFSAQPRKLRSNPGQVFDASVKQTPSLSRFRSRGRSGMSYATTLRHLTAGLADDLDITAVRVVQRGQWVGGVRRCSFGVCGRTFPTRDPR